MPVANLLAIRGKGEDALTAVEPFDSSMQAGFIVCREMDCLSLYPDDTFELPETDSDVESQLLVFTGADCIYQRQLVPLLKERIPETEEEFSGPLPAFVLEGKAEFGLIGVSADRIIRITKNEEVDSKAVSGLDSHQETCQINNCEYRFLDLNCVVEGSDFTLCGLKVSRRLA